jgi:hypothetical protein
MSLEGKVARTGKKKSACSILVGKPKNRDHLVVIGTVEGMMKWIFNRSVARV